MLRRGEVHQDPVAGERAVARVGPDEAAGARLVADLYIGSGERLAAEHHTSIRERFTVIRGRVGFSLGGRHAIAEPGASMEVPPGLAHDWWNAGDDEAHVLVEIAPAARFEATIRNSFGPAEDPPRIVRVLLFSMLALIGRLFGYRGS
jgi:mannose-6-phosphate isomerase-like protein (cupin superfamily)